GRSLSITAGSLLGSVGSGMPQAAPASASPRRGQMTGSFTHAKTPNGGGYSPFLGTPLNPRRESSGVPAGRYRVSHDLDRAVKAAYGRIQKSAKAEKYA